MTVASRLLLFCLAMICGLFAQPPKILSGVGDYPAAEWNSFIDRYSTQRNESKPTMIDEAKPDDSQFGA